jgi:hypothetical protein
LTVGLYPNGQPGEIFIRMAKEGSTIAGLMECFGTVFSLSLQHGVPLKVLCDKLSHTRFEPSGWTGNEHLGYAKSIMDYIFRWLELRFLSGTQLPLFSGRAAIAPVLSMRASLGSSRQRSAPSSKDNDRAGCMCFISIPKSTRPRSIKLGSRFALTPVGGGGTNFAPCFRWLDERGIVPQTLVFLTDLCGTFPEEESGVYHRRQCALTEPAKE